MTVKSECDKRVNNDNPKLEKMFDMKIEGALITFYIDVDDHIVLGGFGWYELFDWEEKNNL